MLDVENKTSQLSCLFKTNSSIADTGEITMIILMT